MIRLSNIVKSFGEIRILDGVSVEFAAGQVVGIVGPSGGGKSTLLRCINGLETFEAGEIAVGDLKLTGGARSAARTAREASPRRRHGLPAVQPVPAHECAAERDERAGTRPGEAARRSGSGGPRTCSIASASPPRPMPDPAFFPAASNSVLPLPALLAVNPAAILFDEPTSALDPRMSAEVMKVIDDLSNDAAFQTTMVIVTHDIPSLRRVADALVVLDRGAVAFHGPPDNAPAEYLE